MVSATLHPFLICIAICLQRCQHVMGGMSDCCCWYCTLVLSEPFGSGKPSLCCIYHTRATIASFSCLHCHIVRIRNKWVYVFYMYRSMVWWMHNDIKLTLHLPNWAVCQGHGLSGLLQLCPLQCTHWEEGFHIYTGCQLRNEVPVIHLHCHYTG